MEGTSVDRYRCRTIARHHVAWTLERHGVSVERRAFRHAQDGSLCVVDSITNLGEEERTVSLGHESWLNEDIARALSEHGELTPGQRATGAGAAAVQLIGGDGTALAVLIGTAHATALDLTRSNCLVTTREVRLPPGGTRHLAVVLPAAHRVHEEPEALQATLQDRSGAAGPVCCSPPSCSWCCWPWRSPPCG
ncbi:MAG: hypothetical protein ACOCXJ_01780, partial [Planctomycetota bacterium]